MSNLSYQGNHFRELIRGRMIDITKKLKEILEVLEYNEGNSALILMIIALISDLCIDPQIREYIASNPYGILEHFLSKILFMLINKPLMYYNY